MKFHLISLLLLFNVFLTPNICAQSLDPSFVREKCEVQIFKLEKEETRKIFERSNKNDVVISFNEGFEDSLYLYVAGALHMKEFAKSDTLGSGNSCAASKINFKPIQEKNPEVVIVIPKLKVYTTFRIDKKYALIKVHRLGSIWYVVKTNYVPVYQ